MSEQSEQIAYFTFIRSWAWRYSELRWIYAIPNGIATTAAQAGKARASGVTKGVWDICCPFPAATSREMDEFPIPAPAGWPYTTRRVERLQRDLFCPGLYIELKSETGRLTSEQKDFQYALLPFGYRFEVCRSWIEAARVTGEHLCINDPDWVNALTDKSTDKRIPSEVEEVTP